MTWLFLYELTVLMGWSALLVACIFVIFRPPGGRR